MNGAFPHVPETKYRSTTMPADKLDLSSPDLMNENFEKLAALFPNCVTESAEGKAIDFDLLKQELNHAVVEGTKERYRLEWPGKKEAIVTANLPTTKTLRPVREDSVDFDNTENIYIEGDNLEVLKLLQESYLGKIKMIYIDPPYNTGKDFVYKDNFTGDRETELFESGQIDELKQRLVANPETAGRYHSDWLSMMYPRLKLARNLLTDDGVIFISIDDHEVHNLKKVCDEIFGESNFVTCFPRITKKAGKTTDLIAKNNDYLLCFRKSINSHFNSFSFEMNGYKHSDEYEATRGKYKLSQTLDYGSIQYSPSLDYEINFDGHILRPGNVSREEMLLRQKRNPKSDFCWRWSEDLYNFGLNNGFIVLKKSNNGYRIYTKTYENAIIVKYENQYAIESKTRTKSYSTLDLIDNKFSNDNSKKDLSKLFDRKIFEYSKPVSLLSELISLTTSNEDIVLDFFSGSSTTAHAVMYQNALNPRNVKHIMIQIPEATDSESEAFDLGFKTICEIGKERIRRAAKKIKAETGADIDYGFRVYRLDSSNMQDVYYRPQDYQQASLDLFADNVKPDRTADDLLAQIMLDWGLPLSLKIEQAEVAGKNVFKVAGDSLYACFDKEIDEAFAKAIAKEKPLRIVFRDNGFKDDTAKTNVKQLLKQLSPETEMKVI